jgi:hypothetical protein
MLSDDDGGMRDAYRPNVCSAGGSGYSQDTGNGPITFFSLAERRERVRLLPVQTSVIHPGSTLSVGLFRPTDFAAAIQ